MSFPVSRFRSAGATEAEVAYFVNHFNVSSEQGQRSIESRLASLSEVAIKALLSAHRTQQVVVEPEPVADTVAESAPEPAQEPASVPEAGTVGQPS